MIRGKTRHQLFLPDDMSKRLAAMAKSQKRARCDLLLEMVDAYMNRRSTDDERIIGAKLDRIARAVEKGHSECFIISHSLSPFIRHQLIYNAALPAPGEEAIALGKKRYQAFLDAVARIMAQPDNDNKPPAEAP